ncbi:endosomal transmembrane epsin interactor 1 isoform X1 [Trichomycterus rosablanca]|uniref:endosomal transmembrane epsin interactor 1 isoform X1 n=1 Tax=Trichomycterus rosablanca TaxID=2290929 RepID=UPI002F35A5EE
MVALSFGALSLSNSPPVRNSCPFWAGSSVILSGIIGLTTWKRPMLLLVNLFVLLSMVCILLNLAGFILCCQGAQLVTSTIHCQLSEQPNLCNCCAESSSSTCPEDGLIKIYAGPSCEAMRVLLKKVLFALCALNALTTVVCLIAAALRYLQIFSTRQPCLEEPRNVPEQQEQQHVPDPEEFVPPAPPPSYFSTFYSYTPRLARRMFGDSVIPLPHIYGARIKGVEVFCPLEPPPPYEAVASEETQSSQAQDTVVHMTDLTDEVPRCSETDTISDGRCMQTARLSPTPSSQPITSSISQRPQRQRVRRSNSDPVLLDLTAKVMSCEAATQTELASGTATGTSTRTKTEHGTVSLRRGRGPRRPRPTSMVDYQSYRDTKLLVARFLQHQSPSSLTPEVQELINSIKSVLRSDQEHMEEAVRCANYIQQVMTVSDRGQQSRTKQTPTDCTSNTLPLRKRPGLIHLRSCGDLSTFTWADLQTGTGHSRTMSRTGTRTANRTGTRLLAQERPHSLIGVSRETIL